MEGNAWARPERARAYLERAAQLPHRGEGEAVLVGDLAEVLPGRILDLGCGDGRLTGLLIDAYPGSTATCLDLSPVMLDAAAHRFAGTAEVSFVQQRLDDPLTVRGPFDAVVSSLAVHHVTDERKRSLTAEVTDLLAPGGIFANLDIVASPTPLLHERWREEMDAKDDPSDRLRDLTSQLRWFDEAGLREVDCIWKWRSLALMRGQRPAGSRAHP